MVYADGRFVETRPDSLETEAEKKAKPKFSSDAGRTVYGGGGITPDVIVPDDTLTTIEQDLLKSLAPKAQAFVTVLNQYAFELKSSAPRNFVVTPAWRAASSPDGGWRHVRSALRRCGDDPARS